MKIKLYQIKEDLDARGLAFRRYESVEKLGGVRREEYALVYEGDVEADDLEDVYVIFNRYDLMPEGFAGRSISVSDVVVCEEGAFFCDAYGFIKLNNFEED